MMPPPIQAQPRCSRTPCHTSQAPPISKRAATAKRAMERTTDMGAGCHGRGPEDAPNQWVNMDNS